MIGVIGIVLSLAVLIFLSYKNLSVFYVAIACTIIVVFTNGLDFTSAIVDVYMGGVADFVLGYFGMILCGAILAKLYEESGAAISIARTIMKAVDRPSMKASVKQTFVILIIIVAGALMAYGGIHVTVLIFTLYPLALSMCEEVDIPKRHVVGLLMGATCTFAMTGAGSPQMPNVVPMNTLGTPSTSGIVATIVGAIVEVIVMTIIINLMINRDRAKGIHFEYGPTDIKFDEGRSMPNFIISLLPLIIIFVLFNVVQLNIVVAEIIGLPIALLLFWPQLKPGRTVAGIFDLVTDGAHSCAVGLLTMGSVMGYASVVKETMGFQAFVDLLLGLEISPYIKLILGIAILCALTGASSTGILLVLPDVAGVFIGDFGLAPAAVHRISSFSSSMLDSLPNCGCFLMASQRACLKVKDSYPTTFVSTVFATTCGTIAVTIVCSLLPNLP